MAHQRLAGSGQGTRPAGTHAGVRDSGHQSQTRGRPVAGIYSMENDDVLAVVEEVPSEPTALELAARAELAKREKAAAKAARK